MVEDDPDLEEDEVMKAYREKRLAEMWEESKKPIYGKLFEFEKSQWDREVMETSKQALVIILLYQPHIEISLKLGEIFDFLAQKHKHVKFLKIQATKCIENYKDFDVPGVLMYKDGDLKENIIPAVDIFGGLKMNVDTVEFVLAMKGAVPCELEDDPREKLVFHAKKMQKRNARENQDESDEDDDREYNNN